MPTLPDHRFWAKVDHDKEQKVCTWHSLRGHSADVAACFEALLTQTILRKRLATLLGWSDLDSTHIARLSALAAIHDAGKVNQGFQIRRNKRASNWNGHVSEMISIFGEDCAGDMLTALGIVPMMEWFDLQGDEAPLIDMLAASWAHHGRPVNIESPRFKDIIWKTDRGLDPMEGLASLGQAIEKWFPRAYEGSATPFPDQPAFRHAFNGVLNLADWMGSNRRFFPFDNGDEHRMSFARDRADKLLKSMHLNPEPTRDCRDDHNFRFQEIAGFEPYEIQQACMDLPIDDRGNLTILESDTGSGKTEAALARFVRLYLAGEVDGMYFAVPTRSAAKQLQNRIQGSLRSFFGPDGPPTTLAIPGYIRIDQLDGDPHALPGYEVQWPDDRPNIHERAWAAESPKRFLAAPVAVGTVDQVLMSALQIKHSHLRAAALHRHFLVVDEIHSSDEYMHHLLHEVIDHHLDAGGHALLMSATIGSTDRLAYATAKTQSPPPPEEASELDYPLLTHVAADRKEPQFISASSSDYRKTVEPTLHSIADDPQALAKRALQFARRGARVLVIRNLVDDCVQTQRALESLCDDDESLLFGPGGQVAPHHSRYAPSDRRLLDRAIETSFGKKSSTGAIVAVATQTVEQSLDIDADILLTDLCPADVLLQRIGRLHRHPARQRPSGFETAQVNILVPQERDLGTAITTNGNRAGAAFSGPHGLGTVYGDLRVLEYTWRQIENDSTWEIPRDNRPLVERTTHPRRLRDLTEQLGDPWPQHETYIEGIKYGQRSHGRLVTVDRSKNYHEAASLDDAELVKTRLGNDDWMVEFEEPFLSPFDNQVSHLTIPAYRLNQPPEDTDEDLQAEVISHQSGATTFRVAATTFVYDRLGLRLPEDSDSIQ